MPAGPTRFEPVAPDIAAIGERLRAEVAAGRHYLPAGDRVLRAFQRPLADVRVLIVGQDPVPDAGPPHRPLVRRRVARAPAAPEPLEHLPGAERRPGRRPRAARRPLGLVRSGRHAAQPRADRRAGRARLPPGLGVGEGHRARHPHARGPARPARRDPVGEGCREPAPAARAPRRSSSPRIRRPSRPAVASSGRGRSRAPTTCWSPRAPARSTGASPRRLFAMLEEEYQKPRRLPRHLRAQAPAERPFAFEIRSAEPRDIPDIREIYNYYVTNSVVTFDEKRWTLKQWREKFEHLQKLGDAVPRRRVAERAGARLRPRAALVRQVRLPLHRRELDLPRSRCGRQGPRPRAARGPHRGLRGRRASARSSR